MDHPQDKGNLLDFFVDHLAFSREVFGPGFRPKGIVDHIRKECDEVLKEPTDASEWIDIAFLAIDGLLRCGPSPREALAAWKAKFEKNKARKWPDWRLADPDKAIEHVRSPEEAPKVETTDDRRGRLSRYNMMTFDQIREEIYSEMSKCSFLRGVDYRLYFLNEEGEFAVYLVDYFAIERPSIQKETENFLKTLRLPYRSQVHYRCAKDEERKK